MSKLKQLILQYCPDGVEYVPLWTVTTWDKKFNAVDRTKQPTVINYPYLLAKDLFALEQKEGNVFLISTGEKAGWTTEELASDFLCEGEVVTIPWGKSRPVQDVLKYYKGKFVTADNRIATSNNTEILLNRYLYYWMMTQGEIIDSFYRGSGIKHPSMADVLDMRIPLPPLLVQSEIVRILDNFTELTAKLTAELTAELAARKKQYEYYRNGLLAFGNDVPMVSLSTLSRSTLTGVTPLAGNPEYYGGDIPWLRTQEVRFVDIWDTEMRVTEKALKETSLKWVPANCVIVAISGATAGRVGINKIPLTTNQHCCCIEIDNTKALYRYVFHCLSKANEDLLKLKQGARGDLNTGLIKRFAIPLPPLHEQERIVAILDRFDSLTTDISSGLPTEIAARQKQYEYYRDKLLSFKEKVS